MSRLTASSVVLFALVGVAAACPFCGVVQPTLSQRRDDAVFVALAEAAEADKNSGDRQFTLHKLFKAPPGLQNRQPVSISAEQLAAKDNSELKPGKLVILFAEGDPKESAAEWIWTIESADETRADYFSRSPELQKPTAERLAFFVKYLEHADAWIAEDAFAEFGHAPYDDVAQVADRFDMAKVREWFSDPAGRERRQGFYALVLGMATRQQDRVINLQLLHVRMADERSDFRAGFDGVLAGVLLLKGEPGLKQVVTRYVTNKDAALGDTRHAMQALRFYHEYGPKESRGEIAEAVAALIDRPEFAAAAITDLSRWEHWAVVDRVTPLYFDKEFDDGPTRRAVVGFLLACPRKGAKEALETLRSEDSEGVAELEKQVMGKRGD